MRKRGILAGFLAMALFLNGCNAGTAKESSTQSTVSGHPETEISSEALEEGTDENEEFAGIPSCKIGDTVSFGSYEQDNNTENGAEAIEWIVLEAEGENVLLLSKYGLDAQAYNSSDEAVTWENSGLRQWLNDTFYKSAFSEAQREVIIPVINVNPDNERWGTSGGNDTNDTVFLLSIEEVESYFSDRNETLWTQATPYAVAQGAFVADNGDSPWWLHSPGDHNDGGFCAAYVDYRPSGVSLSGYAAQRNSRTVRPSLWVKTQSGSIESQQESSQHILETTGEAVFEETYEYEYNPDGLLNRKTGPGITSLAMSYEYGQDGKQTVKHNYNPAGEEMIEAVECQWKYEYDGEGRVIEEWQESVDGGHKYEWYQYEYDAYGNICKKTDGFNKTTYEYLPLSVYLEEN